MSSAKVSVEPLVNVRCLTQPSTESYWIALIKGGGGGGVGLHSGSSTAGITFNSVLRMAINTRNCSRVLRTMTS